MTFLSPSTYGGTMTRYSYDAYGRSAGIGPLATANVYRFYDPQAQRWINRDPLG